jgi:formate dehydrogenase major subunit
MHRGEVKGLFAFGMNGVMPLARTRAKNIDALKKADWLVVCEIYPDETSEFWMSPGGAADEMKNDQHDRLPAPGRGFCGERRHHGQFRALAAVEVGRRAPSRRLQSRSGDTCAHLPEGSRALQKQGGKFPGSNPGCTWSYTNKYNPSLSEISKEINGKALADVTDAPRNTTIKAGQQLPGFGFLRDDGSTACGNWIFCGSVDRGRSR